MNAKIFGFLAFIFFVVYLSGCATGTAPQYAVQKSLPEQDKLPPVPAEQPKEQPAGSTKFLSITPLSIYTDEWKSGTPSGGSFSDVYTRVIIQSNVFSDKAFSMEGKPTGSAPGEISLPYKPRYWLTRAVVGKEFSINLTAKVLVGSLEQTVPLVTIGHSSNSDGEKWTRSIHHDISNFPLFLVKSDGSATVPRIQFSVMAANSYASRGAAAALGVAVQIAKTMSSPPTVVTRLTSESTKNEAQALDNAISKLFGSTLTEEHWTDRDLKSWSMNQQQPTGALIQFSIPESESDFESSPIPVGKWRITFDNPRPSIFVDWRVCANTLPRCKDTLAAAKEAVISDISVGEVLNYKLVPSNPELATIRAYLGGLDWYNTAMTSFATQSGSVLNVTATAFCRRVVNEITGLGLNGFDASAVLWAVYKGMPAVFPNFTEVQNCNTLMQGFASRP